jgi:hypothetical protein
MDPVLTQGSVWARAALDSLRHAHEHLKGDTDMDRRQAVVALDQAFEAIVTAYVRHGPGSVDDSPAASNARKERAEFRHKRDYVFAAAASHGQVIGVTADDISLVRSYRNGIQHAGDWQVPPSDVLEIAQKAALDAFSVLECGDLAQRLLRPVVLRIPNEAAPNEALSPREGARVLRGRRLAEEAWQLTQEIDPEQDGLHVRLLEERLGDIGVTTHGARTLYDALNHAHDLFEALGGAVWVWKERVDRIADALSGRDLADVAWGVLSLHDPDRRGMRYGTEILPIIQRWRVPVDGADLGATLNNALRTDPRFERMGPRTGRYRIRSHR